jgi:hypothetical protein
VPGGAVLDVHERIRVVARCREEPRLDQAPIADPLDPARALRQPHIPQPTAEQAALTIARRRNSKGAKALIDQISVDPLPVIGTAQLVPPADQRRGAQRPQALPPTLKEPGVGVAERQHNPTALPARRHDRRIGVRHQFRDDLHQVDATLRKVLPEVPTARPADTQLTKIEPNTRTHHA